MNKKLIMSLLNVLKDRFFVNFKLNAFMTVFDKK